MNANATFGGSSNKFEVVNGADITTGMGGNVLNSGGTDYGSMAILGLNKIFKADGTTTYTVLIRDLNNQSCFQVVDFQAVKACSSNPETNPCFPVPCVPIGLQKN